MENYCTKNCHTPTIYRFFLDGCNQSINANDLKSIKQAEQVYNWDYRFGVIANCHKTCNGLVDAIKSKATLHVVFSLQTIIIFRIISLISRRLRFWVILCVRWALKLYIVVIRGMSRRLVFSITKTSFIGTLVTKQTHLYKLLVLFLNQQIH